MMAETFDRCPVAAMAEPWLAHVWLAWRAHEKGGLASVEPEPSAMLIQCVDEVARASAAAERRAHDRAMKKSSGGVNGKR